MYFPCTAEIWISKSEQRNAHLYMDTWKQICTTHWHLPVKEGTIGKDRCSLSWIHQTEAMYLPSYQESYQTKLIWEKIWVQEKIDSSNTKQKVKVLMGGYKGLMIHTLPYTECSCLPAWWPGLFGQPGPFHTENQLINMHCMSRHWTGEQNSLNSSHSVSLKRLSKFISRKYVFWMIQTQCTSVLCGPCCEILGPLRISHWTAK